MKVYIGPYTSWFGPYQLAEKLMFWVPKEKDEYGFEHTADKVHKFGEWLAHGSIEPEQEVGEIRKWDTDRHNTLLHKFLIWIESKKKRKIKVRIDKWDTWSMDHTLAEIILPMLKQLQATKHGSQIVDMEDVPPHLRTTTHNEWDDQYCFDFYKEDSSESGVHERWDWVLNEMIWAFEHYNDEDAERQFWTGEHDIAWVKQEDGNYQMVTGPNDTHSFDEAGWTAWHQRKQNALKLFGKYYSGLWD